MVVVSRDHDCSKDCFEVESGEFEHDLIEKCLLVQSLIPILSQALFSGKASLVVDGIGLISIVVCLNEEPV